MENKVIPITLPQRSYRNKLATADRMELPNFGEQYLLKGENLMARETAVQLGKVLVVYREWDVEHSVVIRRESREPLLKMQFELEGGSYYSCKEQTMGFDISIKDGHHQLFYLPYIDGSLFYERSRKSLDILLDRQYLRQFAGNDWANLLEFGHDVEKGSPARLFRKSMPITLPMKQAIYEMLTCPYDGFLKERYMEAKVILLLTLQIQQSRDQVKNCGILANRETDKTKLDRLRAIVQHEPGAGYSMDSLAQMVNMTPCKLKRTFRRIYGTPVFGYIQEVRMQRSAYLLEEEGYLVNEVAFLMGYKYPQHFTKAFKKKFGYLPSDIK